MQSTTCNSIVILFIGCAGLLSFTVLINLNNINIEERTRELATIKLLGFYKKEKTYKKAKQNADAAKEISQQYINIGSEEYTQEIIELVYKKLKPKGKFIAYYFIQNNTGNLFFKRNLDIALRKSNFLYYNTEKVDISKIPEEYRTIYALHLGKESIYRVVAEKE